MARRKDMAHLTAGRKDPAPVMEGGPRRRPVAAVRRDTRAAQAYRDRVDSTAGIARGLLPAVPRGSK